MEKNQIKKAYFVVFLIVATELIGFGLIIPILPQIAESFQNNKLLLGILLSAYSFAQFIASPILGQLSDKYGRKPVLIISKLGTVISYLLFAFSFNYSLILLSRLLDGFTGGNISVARAYIIDITKKEDRAKGMAIIGISFGVGFILGPAIGGVLYSIYNTHTVPAIVAGCFSLIALVLTATLLKEAKKTTPSTHNNIKILSSFSELKSRPIQIICLVQLLFMIIFAGFETSFSIFTNRLYQFSIKDNSWLFFYTGILSLIFQGYITQRPFKNLKTGVITGLLSVSLSFAMLSLLNNMYLMLFSLVFFGLGIGLVLTHLPALLSLHADQNKTGEVMGVYEATGSLSRILGPLLTYTLFFTYLNIGYLIFSISLIFITLIVLLSINNQAQI